MTAHSLWYTELPFTDVSTSSIVVATPCHLHHWYIYIYKTVNQLFEYNNIFGIFHNLCIFLQPYPYWPSVLVMRVTKEIWVGQAAGNKFERCSTLLKLAASGVGDTESAGRLLQAINYQCPPPKKQAQSNFDQGRGHQYHRRTKWPTLPHYNMETRHLVSTTLLCLSSHEEVTWP